MYSSSFAPGAWLLSHRPVAPLARAGAAAAFGLFEAMAERALARGDARAAARWGRCAAAAQGLYYLALGPEPREGWR